jgi:hypothetical protein
MYVELGRMGRATGESWVTVAKSYALCEASIDNLFPLRNAVLVSHHQRNCK